MRRMLVVSAALLFAAHAHADEVTCEQAVAHAISVMMVESEAEGRSPEDTEMVFADQRTMMVDNCKAMAPPVTHAQLACLLAAKAVADLTGCVPAPPAGPSPNTALPAVSADGKTLVLPGESHEMGEYHYFAEVVTVGKTDGEQVRVRSRYIDTSLSSPPVFAPPDTDYHLDEVAELNATLTAGAFAPVPSGALRETAVTLDGVTIAPAGKGKKATVSVSAGGKVVAKTKIKWNSVDQVVVVRGAKQSWIYLGADEMNDMGSQPGTTWTAVKVKLPPKPDVPLAKLGTPWHPSPDQQTAASSAAQPSDCDAQGAVGAADDQQGWLGMACQGEGLVGIALFRRADAGPTGVIGLTMTGGDMVSVATIDVYDAGFALVCVGWHRENGEKAYDTLSCFAPGQTDPVFEGYPDRGRYDFVAGAQPTIVETSGKGKKAKIVRYGWDGKTFVAVTSGP